DLLYQFCTPSLHAGLGARGRDAESFGCLALRKAFDLGVAEGVAVEWWEAFDQGAEAGGQLPLRGAARSRIACDHVELPRLGHQPSPAVVIDDGVPGDLVEPGDDFLPVPDRSPPSPR